MKDVTLRRAGFTMLAAALTVFASPLTAQAAPSKPTTLTYDSVNTVIAVLMPPAQKENVKNVAFSAQGTELRMMPMCDCRQCRGWR